MNSKKSITKLDFQLSQLVFAKQKGYIHWPGIITDFHPDRSRCAKIEFFGWNSQWAFVSFDNLLTRDSGQKVVERNPNNLRFQKAVREMEIWTNGALSMIQKRTVEQESAERSAKSLHRSTVKNENASHKNGLSNSNERFRRATRSSVLSKPLAEALSSPQKQRSAKSLQKQRSAKSLDSSRSTVENENASDKNVLTNSNEQFRRATRTSVLSKPLAEALSSSHTMYACKPILDTKKMIIKNSTEKCVVENSPSFRMTRSKARSTEYENLQLFENAQKVSVKRPLNEEDKENKKKKKKLSNKM